MSLLIFYKPSGVVISTSEGCLTLLLHPRGTAAAAPFCWTRICTSYPASVFTVSNLVADVDTGGIRDTWEEWSGFTWNNISCTSTTS